MKWLNIKTSCFIDDEEIKESSYELTPKSWINLI